VVDLKEAGASLDFLGFTFRDDRALYGGDRRYLNVFPSKNSVARAWDKLRALTASRRCFIPAMAMAQEVTRWLHSWGNYFRHGYPRCALREVNHFALLRLMRHLRRRSQRASRPPEGTTFYLHLQSLGLQFL
jgi:RNA-directed DNA polymerase